MSSMINRRARQYTHFTGAPRQVASQAVATLKPGDPLLPAPTEPAQRFLEAEVFQQLLDTHSAFTEYPLGIEYVVPTPVGIRLRIEDSERGALRADHLLSGLLPSWDPSGELRGIHGLRIRRRTGHGLELHRLGQPTSVWLTGPSRRSFERTETELARRVNNLNWQPCWLTPATTEPEARWEAEGTPLICDAEEQAGAWLPSGLLRRLGLFHQVAVPQCVHGYRALGGGWVLNLDYLQTTALRLGEFLDALTDPANGLPLRLHRHRELRPDENLGLLQLKSHDGTTSLQLRYDRCDYPTLRNHPVLFTAIKKRTGKISAERPVPAMP